MRGLFLVPVLAALLLGALPCSAQGPVEKNEEDGSPPEYVIGVEDVLRIVTWGEPDLTMTAKVRPDGRITLPLVNDVVVAGLTPNQVRAKITEGLAAFVNGPNVTVIVEQINYFRVYFLGEFNTRGPIQFYRPTRLLQGVATAGGLTEFAKKNLTILREEYGVEKRIEIDYKQLIAGNRGHENLYLKAGDTVIAD